MPHAHWKDWCWSWDSNSLATWCEELMHLKRPCCWERLKAGGEGEDKKKWDGWMASLPPWTWVWVNSGSWWWTGRPGMLRFMGSQRVGHNWATELDWTNSTFKNLYTHIQAPLVAQIVKNLPALRETWVQSLGREKSPEKRTATYSSIVAWRIPWTEEPGGLQSMGSQTLTWLSGWHTCSHT